MLGVQREGRGASVRSKQQLPGHDGREEARVSSQPHTGTLWELVTLCTAMWGSARAGTQHMAITHCLEQTDLRERP